jgi:hypothetical protein
MVFCAVVLRWQHGEFSHCWIDVTSLNQSATLRHQLAWRNNALDVAAMTWNSWDSAMTGCIWSCVVLRVAVWINFSRDLMANLGRRWLSTQNKQVWYVWGRSLSIHDRFIEPQGSRIERVKIATVISVRKIDTRRVSTIHFNHAYPLWWLLHQ